MTTIATQHQTRGGLRSTQTRLLIVLALLAVAGVLFVWIVSGGGTASHSLGGPNEAARGAAVYSAAGGAVTPTGGPNEAARGQAVSVASGSATNPGGPDETARGQSVSAAGSR